MRRIGAGRRQTARIDTSDDGGWKATYERLCELDRASPLEPATLIELATAAYLVGKDSEGVAALMRAHQGLVQRRDVRQAAGIAARIASILMNTGDVAQAAGWMTRAARLLEESGESGAERGHLLLAVARQSMMRGNVADAASKTAEAAAIGAQFGDADLINLARPGRGRALIELGDIDQGVSHLDEAMVAVMAGDVSTIMTGIIYCGVISVCSDLFETSDAPGSGRER